MEAARRGCFAVTMQLHSANINVELSCSRIDKPMETGQGESLPFQFNFGSPAPAEEKGYTSTESPEIGGWLPAEEVVISRQVSM